MTASNPYRNKVRPKFGLDLDGVVFAFDIGACLALKFGRGVDIDVRESTCWNDIKERCSPQDWKWLWDSGVRRAFEYAPIYPGVPTQLRQIQESVDLIVITHRPRKVIDITLRKLADIGLRPVAVHHVQGQDKSHIADDCIGYVDDKVENVIDLATTHDVPVFTPRKGWNRLLWDPTPLDEPVGMDIRPYDNFEEITQWVRQLTA